MGVKDYVGKATKIKQSTTFDIKELYKNLKKWIEDRGYKISEPNYSEKPTAEGKSTTFFWSCGKKAETYTKLVLELNFNAQTKDVTIDKEEQTQTLQQGDVEIVVNTYISKDVEDDWAIREKSGISRLLREIYDTFTKKNTYDEYENKLKKDKEAIVYDIKTYLKMQRFD